MPEIFFSWFFLLLSFLLNFVRKITICTIMTKCCTCEGKESVEGSWRRRVRSRCNCNLSQVVTSCGTCYCCCCCCCLASLPSAKLHTRKTRQTPFAHFWSYRLPSMAVLKHLPNILAHISIELSVNYWKYLNLYFLKIVFGTWTHFERLYFSFETFLKCSCWQNSRKTLIELKLKAF